MQTTPSRENASRNTSVEKLQEFLRSEISAVETYELALKSVTHVGLHRTLQEILTSHSRRTAQLRDKIATLGAEPDQSSGVWGAFAKVFQVGADLLGERAAIAALEEGEDRSVEMYSSDLKGCDAKTQKLIDSELLPEQRRTHDLCRTLKTYVTTPS
jgi:demethoxyubiquinone hydroxylase (CLK1/Coq7/Cat5 family)